MSWWSNFDRAEVATDFARIAACGLDSVRVFLTWEDFQPAPNQVDRAMLERLVAVADLAAELGLALIPTLFTGHMSGVNWIPAWALGGSDGDPRFRIVSRGRVAHDRAPKLVHGHGGRNCSGPPCRSRPPPLLPVMTRSGRGTSATRTPTVRSPQPGHRRAPGLGASPRRSAARTTRRSSRSGCTWKTWKTIGSSGRSKPPASATSSRCTATRSTPAGRTVQPTTNCSRSSPA